MEEPMPSTTPPGNKEPIQFESFLHSNQHIQNFEYFVRGVIKTKEVADAAQGKVEEAKETGAKSKMVEELKRNPSTILEDAGKKLEVAKDSMKEKLEVAKEVMEERVEEVKENSSTILEDAGEKLEAAKDGMKEKLEVSKEAMDEKVEEMKEKMAPEKDDGSASEKDDSV